jgi:hypothetical protein
MSPLPKICGVLALLILNSCASKQIPASTQLTVAASESPNNLGLPQNSISNIDPKIAIKQKQDAATGKMIACFQYQAKQLDDHKSDAETIGYAITAACRQEITDNMDTYTEGFAFNDRIQLRQKATEHSIRTATSIVLAPRKASQKH